MFIINSSNPWHETQCKFLHISPILNVVTDRLWRKVRRSYMYISFPLTLMSLQSGFVGMGRAFLQDPGMSNAVTAVLDTAFA